MTRMSGDATPHGAAHLRGERRPPRHGRWGAVAGLACTALAVLSVQLLDTGRGTATAAACDAVEIPSLELSRCVVAGDQNEIDGGSVVRVTYLSSDNVHWLAGHRTSHGATFEALPGLRIGSTVRYRGQIFVVTDYRLVDRFNPDGVIAWLSSAVPSVVLQTSATGDLVHVWRSVAFVPAAPLVATAPPPVPG